MNFAYSSFTLGPNQNLKPSALRSINGNVPGAYTNLAHPKPAPIKSVYYWGWSTNDDVATLNAILGLTAPNGGPQITNLHVFMNFPKDIDPIDPNNPVQALTVCPGPRTDSGGRLVACSAAACAASSNPNNCDVYGTMEDQLMSPVDPTNLSKGIKLDVYGPILQQMRKRGISIILSMLGGHGQLGPRTPMAAQGTKQLAQYFIDFIGQMNWDGIDFDDEYYDYADGLPTPMIELYKALYEIGHPLGYTFSLPFYTPQFDLFTNDPSIEPYVDYAMDMQYSGNQQPTGGAKMPKSKYMFGVGVQEPDPNGTGKKYAADCTPSAVDRSKYPQGVMTFGGPWSSAASVVNNVATVLYPTQSKGQLGGQAQATQQASQQANPAV